LEQFLIFINRIEPGGLLIYNETDETLKKLVEENPRPGLHYQPYGVPQHSIQNGVTTITIGNATGTLKVFGTHNLLNLHAAYYACKQTGINDAQFVQAVSTFAGAAKRLEVTAATAATTVYRDFAHAPSKVKATIDAVKQQYPNRNLLAVLELHTYSSLNADFMKEYSGAMNGADEAVVFYANHALELKRMPPLPRETVLQGFNKPGLQVITNKTELQEWLSAQNYNNANLLLMSSGNYDGLDVAALLQEKLGNCS
jgi:UDP-N-acetylmuramate: L-alanyl-gamma-D-glutamyl-meso-diaminopimelate ligase